MSEHIAQLVWTRTTPDFDYRTYTRDHVWRFDNGSEIAASATPAYLGNPALIDPEEAYVASLASCHMLTFLALATRKRFIVDRYEDKAVGYVEKNAEGKLAVTRVLLQPSVTFSGDKMPTADDLSQLHDMAHRECFIANSVLTEIEVKPA